MNKFWEWMEKKGYGTARERRLYDLRKNIIYYSFQLEQMLVGYMIEYLEENYNRVMLEKYHSTFGLVWHLKVGSNETLTVDKSLPKALEKAIQEEDK